MTNQHLMSAFVSNDRVKGEFGWIRVSVERLRVDREKVMLGDDRLTVLCSTRLAVHMAIVDPPDKTQSPGNACNPTAAGPTLCRSNSRREAIGHDHVVLENQTHRHCT